MPDGETAGIEPAPPQQVFFINTNVSTLTEDNC